MNTTQHTFYSFDTFNCIFSQLIQLIQQNTSSVIKQTKIENETKNKHLTLKYLQKLFLYMTLSD